MDNQLWNKMKQDFVTVRRDVSLLLDRGFTLKKINVLSRIEPILLCAVYNTCDVDKGYVNEIIHGFSEEDLGRYELYLSVFQVIQDQKQEKKDGDATETVDNTSDRGSVALPEQHQVAKPAVKVGINTSSKKRVRIGVEPEENTVEKTLPAPVKSKEIVPIITAITEDRPQKRIKLNKDDSTPISRRIDALIGEVRTKIHIYLSFIIEVDNSKVDIINKRFMKAELKETMQLLDDYGQEHISQRKTKTNSLTMLSALNSDNERLRFKIYEIQSVLKKGKEAMNHAAIKNEPVEENEEEEEVGDGALATTCDPNTAIEDIFASKIAAIRAISEAAALDPTCVDDETLSRLAAAAGDVGKLCEDHLERTITRANELCEAATDASLQVQLLAEKRREMR